MIGSDFNLGALVLSEMEQPSSGTRCSTDNNVLILKQIFSFYCQRDLPVASFMFPIYLLYSSTLRCLNSNLFLLEQKYSLLLSCISCWKYITTFFFFTDCIALNLASCCGTTNPSGLHLNVIKRSVAQVHNVTSA